jgi:hypothetical protein
MTVKEYKKILEIRSHSMDPVMQQKKANMVISMLPDSVQH